MTDILDLAFEGAWQVLAVSLAFGAGLPLVFAFGVRALAWGAGGSAEVAGGAPHRLGKVLGGLCLAVVLAGVALGITIIAAGGFGKAVSFEHGYPAVVAKD